MSQGVSPAAIARALPAYWSPKVIGAVDDSFVKVAKVKGVFDWHSHDDEDEVFFVLEGHLSIELDDETIELAAGELYVVPKGVRHRPFADDECLLLLFEKQSTLHTGATTTDKTRSIEEQLG